MRCPICNKELGEVTPSHAKTHGMTKAEMYKLYPELQKMSFQLTPKNNDGKIRPIYSYQRRMI